MTDIRFPWSLHILVAGSVKLVLMICGYQLNEINILMICGYQLNVMKISMICGYQLNEISNPRIQRKDE